MCIINGDVHFLICWLNNFGGFYWIMIGWFIKLCIQTFQLQIIIHNFYFIIIGDLNRLIGHCLIPLDPWIIVYIRSATIKQPKTFIISKIIYIFNGVKILLNKRTQTHPCYLQEFTIQNTTNTIIKLTQFEVYLLFKNVRF